MIGYQSHDCIQQMTRCCVISVLLSSTRIVSFPAHAICSAPRARARLRQLSYVAILFIIHKKLRLNCAYLPRSSRHSLLAVFFQHVSHKQLLAACRGCCPRSSFYCVGRGFPLARLRVIEQSSLLLSSIARHFVLRKCLRVWAMPYLP